MLFYTYLYKYTGCHVAFELDQPTIMTWPVEGSCITYLLYEYELPGLRCLISTQRMNSNTPATSISTTCLLLAYPHIPSSSGVGLVGKQKGNKRYFDGSG